MYLTLDELSGFAHLQRLFLKAHFVYLIIVHFLFVVEAKNPLLFNGCIWISWAEYSAD